MAHTAAFYGDSRIGLFQKHNLNQAVPLKGVEVDAHVFDLAVDVKLAMKYINDTDNPLEVVYVVSSFFYLAPLSRSL